MLLFALDAYRPNTEKTPPNFRLPPAARARPFGKLHVVRHLRKGLRLGQPAAAIRTALPATASADPEPLTNGL